MKILAIDPGTEKCGLAVLSDAKEILLHKVILTPELVVEIQSYIQNNPCDRIILGSGTGSRRILTVLKKSGIELPIKLVDETNTTLQARERYFKEFPPRGFWRLIPLGLRVPPRPFDDFVAVILAERWLDAEGSKLHPK